MADIMFIGFRTASNSPEVVYFTAILQQQENYEKLFLKEELEERLVTLRADIADIKQMLSQVLAISVTE